MQDKIIYLHIGRHKTGTSSLQNFLYENTEYLERLCFCYPKIGDRINHADISSAIGSSGGRITASILRTRNQFENKTFRYSKIICSSEGFQNVDSVASLNFFFRRTRTATSLSRHLLSVASDLLLKFGRQAPSYHIHLLCYLREFLDYARSAYAQRVQASDLYGTFDAYCQGFSKFNLERFIEFWRAFSDTSQFLSYEQTLARPGGVVTDFLERLDIPLPGATNAMEDKNPSISGHLLGFKLILNRRFPHRRDYYLALRRLAEAEARFRGPFRISREKAAMLRASSAGYNDTLRRTVGEFLERDFSQYPELLDPQRWPADVEYILEQPEFAGLRPHAADIRNAYGELREIGF